MGNFVPKTVLEIVVTEVQDNRFEVRETVYENDAEFRTLLGILQGPTAEVKCGECGNREQRAIYGYSRLLPDGTRREYANLITAITALFSSVRGEEANISKYPQW